MRSKRKKRTHLRSRSRSRVALDAHLLNFRTTQINKQKRLSQKNLSPGAHVATQAALRACTQFMGDERWSSEHVGCYDNDSDSSCYILVLMPFAAHHTLVSYRCSSRELVLASRHRSVQPCLPLNDVILWLVAQH